MDQYTKTICSQAFVLIKSTFLGFHLGLDLVWSQIKCLPHLWFYISQRISHPYRLQRPRQGLEQMRCKLRVKVFVSFSPRTFWFWCAKTILQTDPVHWDLPQNDAMSSNQNANGGNSLLRPLRSHTLYHHLMAVSRHLLFVQKPVSVHLLSQPPPQGSLTAGTSISLRNPLPGQWETPGMHFLA